MVDSKEELIRTTTAVEDLLEGKKGCRFVPIQGLKQRNKCKSIPSSMHAIRTKNSNSKGTVRCLSKKNSAEEEAAKVLDIGKIIGFHFSDIEDEVLESITRREEEDNVRYDATSEVGRAGSGEGLRDSKGVVLCSFLAFVGNAVSWVKDADFGNLSLVKLFYVFLSKLNLLGKASVSVAPRTSITWANGLAKRGVDFDGEDVVWSCALMFCCCIFSSVLALCFGGGGGGWGVVLVYRCGSSVCAG
ncbi:hypothetical protein Q3G72_007576 [Acer saccharum]|nr:hypothetical protein Q3G72_007576 [Acer saccharum]